MPNAQRRLQAGCCEEIDDRELRQELLNFAVGPLEDRMYDTLGAKVDFLSEADLMNELEKLALVKTGTEVMAEEHHPILIMKNPIQQSTLALGINSPITELYHASPDRISKENPTQQQARVPEAKSSRSQKFQKPRVSEDKSSRSQESQKPRVPEARFPEARIPEARVPEAQVSEEHVLEEPLSDNHVAED